MTTKAGIKKKIQFLSNMSPRSPPPGLPKALRGGPSMTLHDEYDNNFGKHS